MLTHSPKDRKHPGDEKFRVSTQQPKKRRHANIPRSGASVQCILDTDSQPLHWKQQTTMWWSEFALPPRPFGKADRFVRTNLCRMWQEVSHCVCGMRWRNASTSNQETKRRESHSNSLLLSCHHHNTSFFGLSKTDVSINGTKLRKWAFPLPRKMAKHRKAVLHILQPRSIPLHPPRKQPAAQQEQLTITADDDNPIDCSRAIWQCCHHGRCQLAHVHALIDLMLLIAWN